MILTTQQKSTLQAVILADNAFNTLPHNEDSAGFIAKSFEVLETPSFQVWKTTTTASDIFDAVSWSNFTPSNPAVAVDALSAANVHNWLLACQGKQFNLQILLGSNNGLVSTGKANIRSGLQDALTNVPSGTDGATKTGGWSNVQLVIQRNCNRLEKLFSTGTGTTASPASLVIEGKLSILDVMTVMGW